MKNKRLTVADVAQRYQVTHQTVYKWMWRHVLPHSKIGGRRLVSEKDIQTFEERARIA